MARQFKLPLWTNEKQQEIWRQASDQIIVARDNGYGAALNDHVLETAERYAESPLGALLNSWAADSLLFEEKYEQALSLYNRISTNYADATFGGVPILHGVLRRRAIAYDRLNRHDAALETLSELADGSEIERAGTLYRMGKILETLGRTKEAQRVYQDAAETPDDYYTSGFTAPQLAQRDLRRIELQADSLAPTLKSAQHRLTRALKEHDKEALHGLASPTHFVIGPAGACGHFEDDQDVVVDRLYRSLRRQEISILTGTPLGEGDKRYVCTDGWRGEWFAGRVDFALTGSPQGWEWSGLALHEPTQAWWQQWSTGERMSNQPLNISLDAPWPAGACFTAGGLVQFIRRNISILKGPFFLRRIRLLAYALRRCGFGTRGFYYNYGPTHRGSEAFAIDFTRYRRGLPFVPRNRGTRVLCAHRGVVRTVIEDMPNGDPSRANLVHVQHEHGGAMRYESRYLHLEGPWRVPVSQNMYIRQGRFQGTIDDTGNSRLHHLHFVVRDIDNGWRSVRPTPMAGRSLTDRDDGKCLCSNTHEPEGWHLWEVDPPPIVEPPEG